jgi:hypothetical protein
MKKQKQKVVLFFIDHDGIIYAYGPRLLAYPKRSKLWALLEFFLLTDQVKTIGFEPYKEAIK